MEQTSNENNNESSTKRESQIALKSQTNAPHIRGDTSPKRPRSGSYPVTALDTSNIVDPSAQMGAPFSPPSSKSTRHIEDKHNDNENNIEDSFALDKKQQRQLNRAGSFNESSQQNSTHNQQQTASSIRFSTPAIVSRSLMRKETEIVDPTDRRLAGEQLIPPAGKKYDYFIILLFSKNIWKKT